jgi:hypothetical protein
MRYMAAQNFVAQNDGFLGYAGMNNFYLYRRENSSQHVLLAWDEDNAFWGTDFPLTMRHDENVLMRKAMQVPELRAAYYGALAEAAASANESTGAEGLPWFTFEVRRQGDLILEALREDPVKPYAFEEHEAARAHMINVAATRPAYVLQQLNGSQPLRRP